MDLESLKTRLRDNLLVSLEGELFTGSPPHGYVGNVAGGQFQFMDDEDLDYITRFQEHALADLLRGTGPMYLDKVDVVISEVPTSAALGRGHTDIYFYSETARS